MLAAVLVVVAGCSSPARVPSDYVQLRYSPVDNPPTRATVTVGTHIAVKGRPRMHGPPHSLTSSVIQDLSWPSTEPNPRGWYPFLAIAPGEGMIAQFYPCSGAGCAAADAEILVTVVPAPKSW